MDNIIEKFDKNIEEIYLKCLDPEEKHNIADCLVKEIQKYKRQYWKLLGIRASFVKWNLICEDSKFEIFNCKQDDIGSNPITRTIYVKRVSF